MAYRSFKQNFIEAKTTEANTNLRTSNKSIFIDCLKFWSSGGDEVVVGTFRLGLIFGAILDVDMLEEQVIGR